MADPIVVQTAPAPDPWYTRTEFWQTLATMILGGFAATGHGVPPMVQNIGATMAGLAPIVYTWGRSNVKMGMAANALNAVGSVLAK